MKIKIAIVDDNERLRKEIESIIKQTLMENVLLKTFSKAQNLLEDSENKFDIYILDIEMPGMNGLELSQRIRQKDKNGEIVFLTSFEKYALQGYRARAYDYLLKEEMWETLPEILIELEKLIHIRQQKNYVIETASHLVKIPYNEIMYIYKDGKNCIFVTEYGEEHQRISLEMVFQQLDAPEFIYVDKGKIVNIRHVKKVVKEILYLTSNQEIVISRSNMKKVRLSVRTYWNSQM